MVDSDFNHNVFVNCPFDSDYAPILQAVLFCLVWFGFKPRIATETSNAAEPRIDKICELIRASKYSIHDLSRCESTEAEEVFRLNMPFELGMDFGCQRYGGGQLSDKVILILEEKQYRLQKAISDLAGSDIEAHGGNYQTAVRKVRNWLRINGDKDSANSVLGKYEDFLKWLFERLSAKGFSKQDIQDYPTSELLDEMLIWFDSAKPRG